MIIDAQAQLWASAALTATAVSTNCYDQGAAYATGTANGDQREIGAGVPMSLIISVGVAADHTTGDETYEFDLITATASDLTTGQVIVEQRVFLFSQLIVGSVHAIPIPSGSLSQRYVGAKYIGGGTTPTVTVSAWIAASSMIQRVKNYTSAIVVG